ncbi:hypothetical protein C0989_003550 [Termitomyces sp. Mn162]|nr:hypothetical protein C0989_003550 [Termitomyces sp. Mn162]
MHNDIKTWKVTHAGHTFAATSAHEHGATVEGTKALGNWSQGTLHNCYDRTLPVDAMLAAASFNGRRQDSYFLAQDVLDPPAALAATIFPWLEEEEEAYQKQCHNPSGNIHPSTTFPLLHDPSEREKQLSFITKLEALYPVEQLKKHQFEWVQPTTESQDDEWLLIYIYWWPKDKNSSPEITKIWNEWVCSIDGYLPVMQLTEIWGAQWHRNNSAAKTEALQCKKIVTLI